MDSVSSSPQIISGTAAELATLTSAGKYNLKPGDYFIVSGSGDVHRWNGTSWDVVDVGGAAAVTIKDSLAEIYTAAAGNVLTAGNGSSVRSSSGITGTAVDVTLDASQSAANETFIAFDDGSNTAVAALNTGYYLVPGVTYRLKIVSGAYIAGISNGATPKIWYHPVA